MVLKFVLLQKSVWDTSVYIYFLNPNLFLLSIRNSIYTFCKTLSFSYYIPPPSFFPIRGMYNFKSLLNKDIFCSEIHALNSKNIIQFVTISCLVLHPFLVLWILINNGQKVVLKEYSKLPIHENMAKHMISALIYKYELCCLLEINLPWTLWQFRTIIYTEI